MNEVMVFNNAEFDKIKDFQREKPNPVVGIVYAVEYDNRFCKIGMSSVPAERTHTIKHYIGDYMQKNVTGIMISKWHTNYRENEKLLHEKFKDCRLPNTELFSVDIAEISELILNGGILLEDNSEEILSEIQKGSKAFLEFGKAVLRGDYSGRMEGHDKNNFFDVYEQMLNSATCLSDDIIFTGRAFVDDYRAFLEEKANAEIMQLKAFFIDKWVEHGLLNENLDKN